MSEKRGRKSDELTDSARKRHKKEANAKLKLINSKFTLVTSLTDGRTSGQN